MVNGVRLDACCAARIEPTLALEHTERLADPCHRPLNPGDRRSRVLRESTALSPLDRLHFKVDGHSCKASFLFPVDATGSDCLTRYQSVDGRILYLILGE